MLKKLPVFLNLLCFCCVLPAQQIQPIWQLREPTDGGTEPHAFAPAVLLDSFQNIFMLGEIYAPGVATGFTIIKYEPDGHKLWERSVQTDARDFLEWAVTDRDGAVYVAGQTLPNPIAGTNGNQVIFKYAPNGDTLWFQYFQLNSDALTSVIQRLMLDEEQNLLIMGSFNNPTYGWAGIFVQKRTPEGSVIWTATYTDNEHGFALEKAVWSGDHWVCWGRNASTANGGTRLLCWQVDQQGQTISAHVSELNPEIIYPEYIDQTGNALMTKGSEHKLIMYDTAAIQKWTFQIPSVVTPQGDILAMTTDNEKNIYVSGLVRKPNHALNIYVTKLNKNGEILWQNEIIDGKSFFDRFLWLSDSSLLATGIYTTNTDSNFFECSFGLIHKSGLLRLWNSDIDGRRNHIYGDVFDAENVYVTGLSGSENAPSDINRQFLAKYSLNALVETGEPARLVGNMSVWPNPFVDHAGLHIVRGGPPEKGRLTVRDMSGRLVSVQEILVGSSEQTITLECLDSAPPGVYSVMLAVGNAWYEALAVKMR